MQSHIIVTTPEELKEYIFECIEKANIKNTQSTPLPVTKSDNDELITRQDVAHILKLKSLVSVDNLSKKGLLKKHRLGGVVRFKRGEVIAFANNQKKRG